MKRFDRIVQRGYTSTAVILLTVLAWPFEGWSMRTSSKKMIALAFGLLAIGWSGEASATWPTSVVGKWTIIGNVYPGVLDITSQVANGPCSQITGTLSGPGYNSDPITGYYCPGSGHIAFLRTHSGGGVTFQAWRGALSNPGGSEVYMGGTFDDFVDFPNDAGEFNFQGKLP